MNCTEIDVILDRQLIRRTLPEDVEEHLRACARCRKLADFFQARPAEPEVSSRLQLRIQESIAKSAKPVRPLPRTRTLVLSLLAAVSLPVGSGLAIWGTGAARLLTWWQLLGVIAVVAAGAALLAASLERQMIPGSPQPLPAPLLVVFISLALIVALVVLFPWNQGTGFVANGIGCSRRGLLFAAPAALGLWLIARRGVALSPGVLGATGGLLAGLAGVMVLESQCVNLEAPHRVVWHAGVPVVTALVGFALAKLHGRQRRVSEG